MAGFNFLIPLFCIPIASNNAQVTINIDVCLGDYYQLFFRESNIRIPNTRVSVQGVESLWGDCMFIPADWGS